MCDLGRLDEATAAYREAHSIDSAALGGEHLHTATDAASVGVALAMQRKWREALPHLDGSHRLLAATLEASHPNLVAVSRFLNECHEKLAEDE